MAPDAVSQAQTPCPRCASATVTVTLTTTTTVFLRCNDCRHNWSVENERKKRAAARKAS